MPCLVAHYMRKNMVYAQRFPDRGPGPMLERKLITPTVFAKSDLREKFPPEKELEVGYNIYALRFSYRPWSYISPCRPTSEFLFLALSLYIYITWSTCNFCPRKFWIKLNMNHFPSLLDA